MQTYFEISTLGGEASYDLYIWILNSCLEFSPFSLAGIQSQAVIHDSREGSCVINSDYTLADFK
jgi:hypothetical protein